MTIRARALTGGILVENVPPDVDELYYNSSALLGIQDNIGFNAGTRAAGDIIGNLAWFDAGAGVGAGAQGETIYFATERKESYLEAEAQAVSPGPATIPTEAAVTDLDTVNVSSGQTEVNFETPAAAGDQPFLRYCLEVAAVSTQFEWAARDDIAGILATSILTGSRAPTTTDGAHGSAWLDESANVLYRKTQTTSGAWRTASFHGRTVVVQTSSFSYSLAQFRQFPPANSDGRITITGWNGTYGTAAYFRAGATVVQLDAAAPRFYVASSDIRTVAPSTPGAVAGSVVYRSNDAYKRVYQTTTTNRWDSVLDADGGAIHVVTSRPSAGQHAEGDYAVDIDPDADVIHVWLKRRNAAATRTIEAFASGEVIEGLTNGETYSLRVSIRTFAGLGAAASTTFTPSATPDAPAGRSVKLFNGGDDVIAAWDDPDSVEDVDLEYRPGTTDQMGNTRGHQKIVTGSRATRFSIDGLPRGSEARVRVLAKRNPRTAGAETVLPHVGVSSSGVRLPSGQACKWYDELPPGDGAAWQVRRTLVTTFAGSKYIDFSSLGMVLEAPDTFDEGVWLTGRSYRVGAVVITQVVQTIATVEYSVPRTWRCIVAHEQATAATQPGVGANWRSYWEEFGVNLAINPAEENFEPEGTTTGAGDTYPVSYGTTLLYDEVEPRAGDKDTRQANQPGEIQFGYRDREGAFHHTGRSWTGARQLCSILQFSLEDRNGVLRIDEHAQTRPGDTAGVWFSNQRWLLYRVLAVKLSENNERCHLTVQPIRYDERDGSQDMVDGNFELRLSASPPTIQTPLAA